jgi:hypothetical protein
VTWRARRAEQVNEILDRASVYLDDDLSMEEVGQRFRTSREGVPAVSVETDGEEEEEVAETLR